ncbi:MAG: hypothetical protein AAGF26_05375 [Cyanobacteria bacterium P01_G01_bin.49]
MASGLHITMATNKTMTTPPVMVESSDPLKTIVPHQAIAFNQTGDAVKFSIRSTTAQILFALGKPTSRENVWAGPFCLSTQPKASDALKGDQQGRMGILLSSF